MTQSIHSHILKLFYMFGVLVCDMFFDERRRFKQFLTSFAPEFAFIFLFKEWFNSFCQLSGKE